MKKIPLTKGKYVIVDDEDYAYLSRFVWQACKDNKCGGYRALRTINIKGQHIGIHIEYFILNKQKGCVFLHENRNGLDCRKENIFVAKTSIGSNRARKRKLHAGRLPSSQYKGVSWNPRSKQWEARVYRKGFKPFRGGFKNEIDAALEYNKRAEELYGEYAYQNEI